MPAFCRFLTSSSNAVAVPPGADAPQKSAVIKHTFNSTGGPYTSLGSHLEENIIREEERKIYRRSKTSLCVEFTLSSLLLLLKSLERLLESNPVFRVVYDGIFCKRDENL
jgi:hypothetical protein